ncbi:MAG: 50S ribosomal protein L28 [Chloroflexota bacterium]|nr:50S ribosomal protein L28 [Chloroflexota bacterium]
MSGKCEVCGKTTMFGHNVSFSKRRTNRRFVPNIQRKQMVVDGVSKRVNVCTRCMRTAMKSR